MNLVLDIGNSHIKAGLFEDSKLLKTHQKLDEQQAMKVIEQLQFDAMIVSTVATCPSWLNEILQKKEKYFLLNGTTPLPFPNLYQTPHTLGTDRIAAIAGAMSLFPEERSLAIDAGTCITYDLLDAQHCYHGGSISPGLQMRCKAMHTFTARLPLVHIGQAEANNMPLQGNHTQAALQSGAFYGTLAEITQMIRMYEDKFGDLQVVICGGDAALLSKELKITHHFVPELILIGLNRILEHNVL